jgi:putative ABC transport system permease protein
MRYYMPLAQFNPRSAADGIVIRTTPADARGVASLVKSMVPANQRATVEVINDRLNVALRPWMSATWLFAALGVLALALACVGIYSVMSYIASERITELGIRVVLGATSTNILRLVVANGLKMTIGGGVLGVVTGAIAGHYLGSLLFGVSPFDLMAYGAGFLCMAVASIAAVLPPAIRASRVDPIAAFRSE